MHVLCVKGQGRGKPHKEVRITNDVFTSQLHSTKNSIQKGETTQLEFSKVLMFIEIKGEEILASMDQIDPHDQFERTMIKWRKIIDNVTNLGHLFF